MAETQPTDAPEETDAWGMTAATRDQLRRDDKDAWKGVVGLLLFIVSVGIILAVLTVWLSGLLG
jgi:hypothetical protein